jgi:hypothetical protein
MPSLKFLAKAFLYFILLLLVLGVIYILLPVEVQPQYRKVVGISLIVLFYGIIIVDLIFLLPTVKGAIYYPSSDEQIATILKLAQIKKGEKAVDIGSGDGRIVVALARAGADAHGYEINPFLVVWSWWKSKQLPPHERGTHHWANLWTNNFSQFQVVTLFGMTYIMKDLEKKFIRELKPGARVICNSFPFPNWKPSKKMGSVYLYEKK